MTDQATPAKVRLTDGLGPLTATAFMYARRYGNGLTFTLPPEDTEDVDDEDPRPPKPLYLLTPEDVAAVNAARKAPGAEAPRWWKCDTHGAARAGAWGCPECVRELRAEKGVLEGWITAALGVLRTLAGEDSEDGGEELRKLLDAGKRLVCKHPAKQTKNFTYGMRSHCPDCGHSEESWWD